MWEFVLASMSIGLLETPNVHRVRPTRLARELSTPEVARVSPKEQEVSPSRRRPTTPTPSDAKAFGLGITTPSQVLLQDGFAEASLKSPLSSSTDGSNSSASGPASSTEYLVRLQESRDRMQRLRKTLGGSQLDVAVSEDASGSSSISSSLRNHRSSSDSSIATTNQAISQVPTDKVTPFLSLKNQFD